MPTRKQAADVRNHLDSSDDSRGLPFTIMSDGSFAVEKIYVGEDGNEHFYCKMIWPIIGSNIYSVRLIVTSETIPCIIYEDLSYTFTVLITHIAANIATEPTPVA